MTRRYKLPRLSEQRDLNLGDFVEYQNGPKGYVLACVQCDTVVIARADARFCSNACRVASSRAEKD